MEQVKVGDKVGYDATSGDVIGFGKATNHWTVISTWPNGCRLENERGDRCDVSYEQLSDWDATYVSLAAKAELPKITGLI